MEVAFRMRIVQVNYLNKFDSSYNWRNILRDASVPQWIIQSLRSWWRLRHDLRKSFPEKSISGVSGMVSSRIFLWWRLRQKFNWLLHLGQWLSKRWNFLISIKFYTNSRDLHISVECKDGESFVVCPSSTEKSCRNPTEGLIPEYDCEQGCACNEHLVRDDHGNCVLLNECPPCKS